MSIIKCVLERQKHRENNREMRREGGRVVSGDSYIIYCHLYKGSGGKESGLQACLANIFDTQRPYCPSNILIFRAVRDKLSCQLHT